MDVDIEKQQTFFYSKNVNCNESFTFVSWWRSFKFPIENATIFKSLWSRTPTSLLSSLKSDKRDGTGGLI